MKNNIQKIMLISGLILMLGLSACSPSSTPTESKPVITVSILPQQYILQRLAGDYFDINVMVEPGESPENYEPSAQQMRDLSDSIVYISIGATFENVWLDKISTANQSMLIVDSSTGIERIPMTDHEDEDSGSSHADGELDPHIWTSPRLVKTQAQNITEALIKLDPPHSAEYQKNLESLLNDINLLDQELTTKFTGLTNKNFMIFHPSMGYFAADYGLTQIPIEIGGTEPSAQELAQFIETAKAANVHVIFVQPEFSKRSAETIAKEIDGTVEEIFVLSPDWLNNMRKIAQTILDANQ